MVVENKKGDLMKKFISFLLLISILGLVYYYQEDIVSYILKEVIYKQEFPEYQNNSYFKNANYNYVSLTDNFYPKNETDIRNALYTILNSGMTSYVLYCDDEYINCLSDVERIATDYNVLSNINNLVHPYNSYERVYVATNNLGKVDIKVDKLYSDIEIQEINNTIEAIKNNILSPNMTSRDKIRIFHDYIINNTVYDSERADEINNYANTNNRNNSHKANGVLNNHIALCSGYTDLMAIFLSNIGVPNYKISTNNHIWNAVYLDNKWYHLDLTWDDPVTNTGENVLIHDYFLITTEELERLDKTEHTYDKTVYGF